jgi:hypothetical protein
VANPFILNFAESATATAGTSHVVTLPGGIVPGALLIVLCNKGSTAATFNALAGWNELVDENTAGGMTAWYREADGTEGASVTFTSSANTRSAEIVLLIWNAAKVAIQPPEISAVATGASTDPNPPSLTPTGGTKDYLWCAFFGMDGEEADDDTWCNSAPTGGWGNLRQKTCGTAGTNLGGLIASALVWSTQSSMDPGTFNCDVSANWRAFTIAIHPRLDPRTPFLQQRVVA